MDRAEKELKHYFPYEAFREGQREIITFAQNVFTGEKIGLLHAPTGVGKTAAALTGYFSEAERTSSDRLMALTRTKSQAKIYIEELAKIDEKGESISYSIIRSKKDLCSMKERKDLQDLPYHKFLRVCQLMRLNRQCPHFEKSYDGNFPSSALRHAVDWAKPRGTPSRLLKAGKKYHVCPYELAKRLISKSKLTICSFNYLFSPNIRENLFSSTDLSFDDTFFIIDEAHGLPSFISNAMSRSLSRYSLGRARKEVDTVPSSRFAKSEIKTFLTGFSERINELSNELGAVSHLSSPRIVEKDVVSHYFDLDIVEKLAEIGKELTKRGRELLPSCLGVADFLKELIEVQEKERYALTVECRKSKSGNIYKTIGYNLIDPSPEAKEVFTQIRGALLLSGSLYPIDYYQTILGLNTEPLKERVEVKILPSQFLCEKRKIIVDTSTTTKYEERGKETFAKIAKRISGVAENLPKDKALLVVFPSYSVKEKVKRFIDLKRPLFEEKRDTDLKSTLTFIDRNPSTVIFSVARGKLTEGIDFRIKKESLLGGVILVGLPFPKFDQLAKYKSTYFTARVGKGKSFYLTTISPAVRASVQAVGRLIRSKEDTGVAVILDRRFERYGAYFPESWRDPYFIETQVGLEAEVSSFFKE